MNRQIKFRGYSGDGVWTYMELKGDRWEFRTFPLKVGTILNPQEWQQFTGLLDKNGKEIYEGDILEGIALPFKVIYSQDGFACDNGAGLKPCLRLNNASSEIIGNIYQNPELVK